MEPDIQRLQYLELLAAQYPSLRAVTTEITNLTARLNLPKGTEHYVSDIHGEYEAFRHIMRNGSGSIKRKIDENFEILSDEEKRGLATLIYYPEQRMSLVMSEVENPDAWCRMMILRLIKLVRAFASKYTRQDVVRFIPDDYQSMFIHLIYSQSDIPAQKDYYQSIIETIIETDSARDVIQAFCELIQRLAVSHLHVIGDIYDRGPGAEHVMDLIMDFHNVDIQWGNHDILWMGAAGGSQACIANVIRISLRYANTDTLETGYGISLLPLASFAMDVYGDDPCEQFRPKLNDKLELEFTEHEVGLFARMQKAITIIQMKVEAQIIMRRPHYHMEDRLLLDKIDYDAGTITLNGKTYPLIDSHLPTIDPEDPYRLTDAEAAVVEKFVQSFANSQRLQKHVRFLYAKGSMYRVYNGNLLYHGCIVMNEDGSFHEFEVEDGSYSAKAFMDRVDRLTRQGYFSTDDPARKQYGLDATWYLWSGAHSPLFGKDKMATFERYFIAEKETHQETRNPYYEFRDREDIALKILREFGADEENGHIINGHVPVKVKQGESPVKANGKLLVIDGGLAEAYQAVTGIAGYTLIFNSYGLLLASHHPFQTTQYAIENGYDHFSETRILETNRGRLRIRTTDEGQAIQDRVQDLRDLLQAYRAGLIKVRDR
jgi:fructose-1,6-bisphosphatase III